MRGSVRSLVLLLFLGAPVTTVDPTPRLRLSEGSARLVDGGEVRHLERRSGSVTVSGAEAYLECGARSELELVWRGLASAQVSGPAAFEFGATPHLLLESFRTAELEARRGRFTVEVSGMALFELNGSAVQLVSTPAGLELLNRGGRALTVRTFVGEELSVPSGTRVRIPGQD